MALIRFRRRPSLPVLMAGLWLLAGCTGQEIYIQEDMQAPAMFTPWVDAKPVYRIGPGDELDVKYLVTPDMDESLVVSPDGNVGLRATGQIEVGGLTPKEAEDKIRVASARYLAEPIVSVQVTKYASSRIFIGGMVSVPGVYGIYGPVSMLEAVVNAGGFREEARADEVVLIRRDPQGKPMMRTVDLQNFIQRLDPRDDVKVFAGDVIFVPRSLAGEVGHWVEQYIDNVLPLDPSFDYTINRTYTTGTGRTLPPL
ncbi:polysaccharide export protein [Zavarzinia compransoris]|uniref:polysaccharide biosynthesis/export family protein n=1 Tax=Zavarzinia marina TaxID=2911065 RepID=UPI001F19D928|nr:polysaccharide biosynthesis/export family protein [Zavarzinia marina]MCF4165095.1 polysaccharide export protein [Zavarzinia marina]